MLSPAWVLDHHQGFDVFHVQFGFDAQDADRLGALVDALRAVRKPLVYTVLVFRTFGLLGWMPGWRARG
jgi:hypothetical protein